MIHIFNRKELITTHSDQQLYRLEAALDAAGIPFQTKSAIPFFSADRYRGTPGLQSDATHPTTVYVKKADYSKATAAIQNP